jgi:hypothetical protein
MTGEGKCVSRRNALRHWLTAETVIEALEAAISWLRGCDYRGLQCRDGGQTRTRVAPLIPAVAVASDHRHRD